MRKGLLFVAALAAMPAFRLAGCAGNSTAVAPPVVAAPPATTAATPAPAVVLKQEPAPGTLAYGKQVYVDDGTCPSGQIKLITGGNKSMGLSRQKKCVPRPGCAGNSTAVAPPVAAAPPVATATTPAPAVVLKQEPAPGTLAYGKQVYVDDGTCPSGQIKLITGENKSMGLSRQKKCVPRPSNLGS
jgi:hypothetical protein